MVLQAPIRPLDTSDDELVRRVHELLLACHRETAPGVPPARFAAAAVATTASLSTARMHG